jgi:hypothetical protein
MTDLENVLANYQRLRASGMEVRAVLHTLRDEIDALDEDNKKTLARELRALEKAPPTTSTPDRPVIRKLETQEMNPNVWVNCPNCGKSNQVNEVLCYACGYLLQPGASEYETQMLAETNDLSLSNDFFGPDSCVILRSRDGEYSFEVRPQNGDVVVGRSVTNTPVLPDIDLTPLEGEELGVSRLHLTLRYDAGHRTVSLLDNGSINGTYINGQRLHPHEVRVLRDADEIRLGRLVLLVFFRHD